MTILAKLLTALLAAPLVLALPHGDRDITDRRESIAKPYGHDARMRAINSHLSAVDPDDIETRAPGFKQLYHDAVVWGEANIPMLSRNIPSSPKLVGPASAIARRQSGSGQVSGDEARNLVVWAQAATFSYCSQDAIQSWTCKHCIDGLIPHTRSITFFADSGTGMQGYVAVNDDVPSIIVSFRGSKNFQNWLQNLNFLKTDLQWPNSNAKVHSGFYNTWEAVRAQVLPAATAAMNANPGYPITFTGHSLGGAVAVMGALDFASNGIAPSGRIAIRTQGQPRVGDPNLYPFMQSIGLTNYIHGINYNDIVPHLPPEFVNFRHGDYEEWVDGNGDYVTCDDAQNNGEDTNCANTTPPWVSTSAHLTYFGVTMGGGEC